MASSGPTPAQQATPGYPAQQPSGAGRSPLGFDRAPNPEAMSPKSASSVLAVLIGLLTFLLLGFFACSVFAIGKRWSRRPEQNSSFQPAVTAVSPAPARIAAAATMRRATVVVAAEKVNGMLRAGPAESAALVAALPSGTVVEVGTNRTVPGRKGPETWFQTRATVRGSVVNGWMHEVVLRIE